MKQIEIVERRGLLSSTRGVPVLALVFGVFLMSWRRTGEPFHGWGALMPVLLPIGLVLSALIVFRSRRTVRSYSGNGPFIGAMIASIRMGKAVDFLPPDVRWLRQPVDLSVTKQAVLRPADGALSLLWPPQSGLPHGAECELPLPDRVQVTRGWIGSATIRFEYGLNRLDLTHIPPPRQRDLAVQLRQIIDASCDTVAS